MEKNSAKAQQHSQAELLLFEIIHFLHAQVVIEGKIKEYSKKSAKTNASFLITWYGQTTIQTKLITESRWYRKTKIGLNLGKDRYAKDKFFDKVVLICIKKPLSDIYSSFY